MSRVRLVLRKEPRKDGTYPIAIRLFKDKKASFIYLDYSVHLHEWDGHQVKSSNPNHKRLNNYLQKKLSEAMDGAIEMETKKTHTSVASIRNNIKPKAKDTFFPQAQGYLDTLKAGGKYNQHTADKPRVTHFKEFLREDDIAFSDITVGMLEKFKAYLRGSGEHGERSAINHLVMVRSIFAYARKNGVIDEKISPFGKGKITIKFPDTKKVGLTKDEVKSLEMVELDDPYNQARNLFCLSYYMAGMRISDVLRLNWSDIQDGRLHYIMGKNNKGDSLKMPDRAVMLLEKYRSNRDGTGLVFHELRGIDPKDEYKVKRQIAFTTSRYDKFLRNHVAPAAGIEKNLTMHIARHTFAQNATEVEARTLQKLFRHTDLSTTVGYMGNFINKQADDALNKVLGD